MLDEAFGLDQDVVVGSIIGVIAGGLLAFAGERLAIARMSAQK
ncbi:MAG TPA: hypothetical protein VNZ55_03970 [Thermomicrobiales bacterium]|nr:hypothetical protein [Thermomicrobiales bacterium]